MPRVPRQITVPNADLEVLERWSRGVGCDGRAAVRARAVLMCAQGRPVVEAVDATGFTEPTVRKWRDRYAAEGLGGLTDRPRSGRPVTVDRAKQQDVINLTLLPPPPELGVTHWSSRLLAAKVGLHHGQVADIWAEWCVQPWRSETFKFSTDPQLEAKVFDIVGLYLDPPAGAVVLCADEKSQIQALERTQPILPLRPGLPERATHDYVRHGTATLYAALEVATGKVIDMVTDRHRHQEFLAFLKKVAKAYPRKKLHIVVDNYATHKHTKVRAWLNRNPRVTLHFTPTSASWMNLVEVFFSIITRQAIQRGSFTSTDDLAEAIEIFIDGWNERSQPFEWTKPADVILTKAQRKRTIATEH